MFIETAQFMITHFITGTMVAKNFPGQPNPKRFNHGVRQIVVIDLGIS